MPGLVVLGGVGKEAKQVMEIKPLKSTHPLPLNQLLSSGSWFV